MGGVGGRGCDLAPDHSAASEQADGVLAAEFLGHNALLWSAPSGRRMGRWVGGRRRGPNLRGSCAAGAGVGARVPIMAIVSENLSKAPTRVRSGGRAQAPAPCLHAIRRPERN